MNTYDRFSGLASIVMAAIVGLFSATAVASDVSGYANAQWLEFSFAAPGEWAQGCWPADPYAYPCNPYGYSVQAPTPPWEFYVIQGGTATITVQDTAVVGDQFKVYDNGEPVGTTSVPPIGFLWCGMDPDICAGSEASSGTFELSEGEHSIMITPVLSPYFIGSGYFRIDGDITGEPPPPQDTDGDGLPDDEDACPMSDLNPTVAIDDCDSGATNTLFTDGCTISDRIQECGNGVRNHGLRVSCVAHLLQELLRMEEIEQIGTIQRCVARDNE